LTLRAKTDGSLHVRAPVRHGLIYYWFYINFTDLWHTCCNDIQDAQLSQRDRAAGCII